MVMLFHKISANLVMTQMLSVAKIQQLFQFVSKAIGKTVIVALLADNFASSVVVHRIAISVNMATKFL